MSDLYSFIPLSLLVLLLLFISGQFYYVYMQLKISLSNSYMSGAEYGKKINNFLK